MTTLRHIFPLLGAVLLVLGCGDDPGSLTNGANPYGGWSGESDGDPDSTPEEPTPIQITPLTPPHDMSFSERAITRGRAWIEAAMPYCGGPNGGRDVICGGICSRKGNAKNAEWDDYRSDCSGFVSWSWGVDAPGATTRTLAPYSTGLSSLITIDDLEPGDALNGAGHVMLFGGWVDKAAGKALVLQETRCGTIAAETVATFKIINTTTLKISDGRTFRPIRYKHAK